MCRLAAFPPMFPKKKALAIMENMYIGNDDGTGSVYVKDGNFVLNKWQIPFDQVVEKNLPLFDHMPYNGWTVAHVRAASHGKKTYENTHPFVKGKWAMAHNGIFQEHKPVKAVLSTLTKFKGQTDSEVAAAFWEVIGREKFMKVVERSGVFMFLKNNGQLDVAATSGDLVFQNTKWGVLFASELSDEHYKRTQSVLEGSFKLNAQGQVIYSKWEKDDFAKYKYGKYVRIGRSGLPSSREYGDGEDFYLWDDDGEHSKRRGKKVEDSEAIHVEV